RHCVSCACPLRARPPRSTLSPYTTLFRSHAQKRLDRIADRHNPLARHACALEIASHALVHENEMRWLIVDIEQALPQEMPNRAPCLLMEAALVALGEEAGCGHGNQIADGGPGEVDEAPVRTGEEIVMRMKH